MRSKELRRRRTQPIYRERPPETAVSTAQMPVDELAPPHLFWDSGDTPAEKAGFEPPSLALDPPGLDAAQVEVMTSARPPIRPYRKPGARGMMASRPGRRTERLLLQFVVCVFIFIVAVVVKLAMPEAAQTVSGWVAEGIAGQVDYKNAFTVIGQSISGGADLGQVAEVISAELFGGGTGATPSPPTETQAATTAPPQTETTTQTAPTSASSVASSAATTATADEPGTAAPESQRQPVAGASRSDATPVYIDDLSLSLSAEDAYDDTDPLPFGVDKPGTVSFANVAMAFDYSDPLDGVMTSAFGYRDHPVDGEYKFHYGLDLAAPHGTPIAAFADGVVEFAGESAGGYGKYVRLKHEGGVTTLYGHCDQLYVKSGQSVKRGETIAAVGQTGVATGDHLHFEVCADGALLNPAHYVGYRAA